MLSLFKRIANRYHYTLASIKNRYPCRIIKISNELDFKKTAIITYQAVTKFNLKQDTVVNILDDPKLIEKFHTTDGVKLGFVAFGEILLREGITIEESRCLYKNIAEKMFREIKEQ